MRFDKEQQQAAFEKWFTSEDGPFLGEKLLYKDAFGNYICPEAYTRFEGWQAALMQASQPQWIPVSEQEPPLRTMVLCYFPDGGIDIDFQGRSGQWGSIRSDNTQDNPTHWMPLPAAPKSA